METNDSIRRDSETDKLHSQDKMGYNSTDSISSLNAQTPTGPCMGTRLKRTLACAGSCSASADYANDYVQETVKTYVHTDGLRVCTSVTMKESPHSHKHFVDRLVKYHTTSPRRRRNEKKGDNSSDSSEEYKPFQSDSTTEINSLVHDLSNQEASEEILNLCSTDSDHQANRKSTSFEPKWNKKSQNRLFGHDKNELESSHILFNKHGCNTPLNQNTSPGSSSLSPSCNYQTLNQSDSKSTPQSSHGDDTTDVTSQSSSEEVRE